MFGNNPKRASKICDGSVLEVQEIFKTLQGEGPHVGSPAVFLRLGGCNLACSFCDTEFESFGPKKIEKIIETIDELSSNLHNKSISKLVVITGGEPFRQEIGPICQQLIARGYKVQIETNGTLFRKLHENVEIICSPKIVNNRYYPIREDLLEKITGFKFIISASYEAYQNVPEVGQSRHNVEVFIQPMDEYNEEKNIQNQKLALKIALEYGYRLSLQTHKYLGIN